MYKINFKSFKCNKECTLQLQNKNENYFELQFIVLTQHSTSLKFLYIHNKFLITGMVT